MIAPLPLEALLQQATLARIAVLGDFCLDAYWEINPSFNENSVETGLRTTCIASQLYSPGGASNVAANLAALGVAHVSAIGLCGNDPFGDCLHALLCKHGIDCSLLLRNLTPPFQTPVFAKPMLHDVEQNRIDFGSLHDPETIPIATLEEILERIPLTHDALIVNQQLQHGILTPKLIQSIHRFAAQHPTFPILVDSRHYFSHFQCGILKVAASDFQGDPATAAQARWNATGCPTFVTCGAKDLLVAAGPNLLSLPAFPTHGPLDTVGAGDSFIAGLAASLPFTNPSHPDSLIDAARFAMLVSTVTIHKIGTTGTATPDELRSLYQRLAP